MSGLSYRDGHNPFQEEIFPDIQFNFPLAQLEAVPSHPRSLGAGPEPHLAVPSCQVSLDKNELPPELPSLQDETLQCWQSPAVWLFPGDRDRDREGSPSLPSSGQGQPESRHSNFPSTC